MTNPNQFLNRVEAFEAGRRVGAKEEHERLAAQEDRPEDRTDGPSALTLDDVRAGRYSDDELIARKPELDALLAGEASS